MLKAVLEKIFGDRTDKDLKQLWPIVHEVNALEKKMQAMSDDELKAQTPKLKEILAQGKSLEDILPEAYATVREVSWRVLKMRHFDVQILGGIVLHRGIIAEMKTGEGKTLCATLPLYLNALSGKGAHLVTVNDYLAKRDANWMGGIYNFLGMSVGVIISDQSDEERHAAYRTDISYGTNNEFVFDYLRDNMKFRPEDYVQRPHNFCIVDEVDSILIDEARTPLLISGPSESNPELYQMANKIVPMLKRDEHFTCDEKVKSVVMTDAGIVKIQEMLRIKNLYEMQHVALLHHLNQALRAWTLFHKDVDYVIKEGKVVIVDEFTGRLKEGSRWSDGLHQSIEAKEGLTIRTENQTLASITFQNYFRMYKKLAGMTGTAKTEAEEFRKIYNLAVRSIPTHMKMVRNDLPDVIYKDRTCKFNAVVKLIEELYKKGQPVLVGTISIETSELISNNLKKLNVPHQVLNAKQHEREAEIIASAGAKGMVTIATNMAGRGTDIKLTEETVKLDGLYILGTERHESRRIDNQLRGRSGRQGDPGTSKFFLSLEDDLMRIFGSERIKKIMNTLGMKDDEPIEHRMISNAIEKAQKKVESHNFDIRKHLLDYDNVMNEQRKVVYALRRDILNDVGNVELVHEMIEDVSDAIVEQIRPVSNSSLDNWSWPDLETAFKNTFHSEYRISREECGDKYDADVTIYFASKAKEILEQKFTKYDQQQVKLVFREILLSILDHHWKDHLLSMDHLKDGISLKAYAQQDPLNAYKKESFNMFERMRMNTKHTVVHNIFAVQLYTKEEIEKIEEMKRQKEEFLKAQLAAHKRSVQAEADAEAAAAATAKERELDERKEQEHKALARKGGDKVGRNDPCPCGSGKKYKHCHGA
ncbi:MAG: preprotein translocase subunit SecA [Oligoflexia bacterium]|nr:preprotein translocase subunit SecA [Oligoflexia bacterium]MBF0366688.1 preprotein translocase subunit SecA [Oligoflexia bacterium]